MPDPNRVVSRSLAMLRRLGMRDADGLHLIIVIASQVRFRLYLDKIDDVSWPNAIIEAARKRLAVPAPSITEYTGDDHGDGNSR